MRFCRSLVVPTIVAVLFLGPAASRAFAVSVKDLIALSHEGLSDAVLVALIETDGSRFTLNADDIRSLKAQGLSDTVLVAMIKTGRPARDAARPAPERPSALAPNEPNDEPNQEQIYTPSPTQRQPPPVVVQQTVTQKVDVQAPRHQVEYAQPVYVPVYVAVPTKPVEVKKEEPVYWGWGGKRRPDAWKEPEPPPAPAKPGQIIK